MPTPSTQPITIFVLTKRDPELLPKLWQIRGYNFKTKEEAEFPPETFHDTHRAYGLLHAATRALGWAWYLDELPG